MRPVEVLGALRCWRSGARFNEPGTPEDSSVEVISPEEDDSASGNEENDSGACDMSE
jgi:hypothetical protein